MQVRINKERPQGNLQEREGDHEPKKKDEEPTLETLKRSINAVQKTHSLAPESKKTDCLLPCSS
jgi:hypothetical protein